jgi:hypothetical protein
MSRYRTAQEYRQIVNTMGIQELIGLSETFNESQTLDANEKAIQTILNNEVERRILNWEVAEV